MVGKLSVERRQNTLTAAIKQYGAFAEASTPLAISPTRPISGVSAAS
jgi:hypothetical protein